MHKLFRAPVGAAEAAIKTANWGGNAAWVFAEGIMERSRPGYIEPEVLAQQAILKQFKDRFGVLGGLMEPDTAAGDLEARASWAAYTMVDQGLVDEHTAVELRPLLPEDSLHDPARNARRKTAVELLRDALAQNYEVAAIPNSHPIIPSEHRDSPVPLEDTWKTIASELDGFSHQAGAGPHGRLAMLAITEAPYAENLFSGQILFESHELAQNGLLVLRHVGERPQENSLLGSRRMGVLESKELHDFRLPHD